jgi:hypothetical protein
VCAASSELHKPHGVGRVMSSHEDSVASFAKPALPSPGRLVLFALILPAVYAASTQLLYSLAVYSQSVRPWLYPWMIFATAVLSWGLGRYVEQAWIRWALFAWCLLLLDLLTISACLANGPLPYHFAYVLVSAQISLLVIWTTLSTVPWQWRLPGALIALTVVIVFATLFADHEYAAQNWHAMLLLTSLVIVLSCFGLRLFGFVLQKSDAIPMEGHIRDSLHVNQFGLKHILIWATAMVPLLLIARGLDFLLLSHLGAQNIFLAALAALTIAAINLVTIYAVLGGGSWIVRLVIFVTATGLLAIGLAKYFNYVYWQNRSFSAMFYSMIQMRNQWVYWLCLDALLLAALLLFLRASGYRLARR